MSFCNLLLSSQRMSQIILLLGSLLPFQIQAASAQIDVDPDFRVTPIWYWKNLENKCIPVPSYDVISRIGPDEIRNEGLSLSRSECRIEVMPRRIEAVLKCDERVIEKFYSREKLCVESSKSIASKQN